MMPRSLRTATVALVAAGAVLLLGACSGAAKPGSAAVVGDTRITDTFVADRVGEITTALQGKLPDGVTEADLNRRVISNEIQQVLIETAAEREAVTVTAGEVADLKNQAVEQSGGLDKLAAGLASQYAIAPSQLDTFVRTQLLVRGLFTKLGKGDETAGQTAAGKYLAALSLELGTQVAPRFGTWSPEQLGADLPPSDLSTLPTPTTGASGPAVEPSPSAS